MSKGLSSDSDDARLPTSADQQARLDALQAEVERLRLVLDATRARWRLASQCAPVGLLEFDDTGGILAANPRARSLLGLDDDHLSGRHLADIVHPDDLDPSAYLSLPPSSRHPQGVLVRRRIRGAGGGWINVEAVVGRLDPGDDERRFLAMFDHFDDVREMFTALVEAKEAAETASRAKTEFLANMGHEIRTPLNGVLGMLQLLQSSSLDADQADYVTTALDAGHGLLDLINSILSYSRSEKDQDGGAGVPYAPAGVLRQVKAAFDGQALRAGLDFTLETDDRCEERFLGAPGRLFQVADHLVSNAVKFTENGHIRLSGAILDGAVPGTVLLRLTVADTGIGIPAEQHKRVFEPFTQVDGSVTRKYQGTGLGLAIVKRLVELMRGNVRLESLPGVGTTVTCDIPLELREAQAGHVTPPPLGGGPRLRLLVVEDDPASGAVANRLLAGLGHVPVNVGNGWDALRLVQRESFDAVLMDISLAGQSGLKTVRRIRALPGPAGRIPIVAATGHALVGNRDALLAAGMDDALQKPLSLEALERMLAGLAERSRGGKNPA